MKPQTAKNTASISPSAQAFAQAHLASLKASADFKALMLPPLISSPHFHHFSQPGALLPWGNADFLNSACFAGKKNPSISPRSRVPLERKKFSPAEIASQIVMEVSKPLNIKVDASWKDFTPEISPTSRGGEDMRCLSGRVHRCDVCHDGFLRACDLKRHKKTHGSSNHESQQGKRVRMIKNEDE